MKIILRNTKLEFQAGTFDVTQFIKDNQEPWSESVDNPEWEYVIVDLDDKLLWGRHPETSPGVREDDYYAPYEPDDMIDGVHISKIVNAIVNTL